IRQAGALVATSTRAELTGFTTAGVAWRGTDSVRIVHGGGGGGPAGPGGVLLTALGAGPASLGGTAPAPTPGPGGPEGRVPLRPPEFPTAGGTVALTLARGPGHHILDESAEAALVDPVFTRYQNSVFDDGFWAFPR